MLYVAGMADDDVRAYGSVAPLKVGLLNDYPTRADTDNDTLDTLRLVFDEAVAAGSSIGRSSWCSATWSGCPTAPTRRSSAAYDELVAEGCLAIFGPYVSDNAVPLAAHADRVAKVPNIISVGIGGGAGRVVLRAEQRLDARGTRDAGRGDAR